jgi:hypothetical protein
MNREKIRQDLVQVILAELQRLRVSPTDITRVMMHSHDIWVALVKSGKMPRSLSYEDMNQGMLFASLRQGKKWWE